MTKRTVNSFGTLELSQAGTVRGQGSSYGCKLELLESMLVFKA